MRVRAVRVLGDLVSDPCADRDLWAALADPDEDVRWAAAVLLAPSGDRRVLLVLLAALRSGNRQRRDTVASALASLNDEQRSQLASMSVGFAVDLGSSARRRKKRPWPAQSRRTR